jgi:hypothetical protein
MTAHAARPGPERHLAALALAMEIEPGEDRLGGVPVGREAAGQIAKALAVGDPDIAMPGAGP